MNERMDPRDLDALAERVARLVLAALEPRQPRSLLTSAQAGEWLGTDAEFARDHAAALGAVRLGSGPRARLRFKPEAVEAFLAKAALPETDEPERLAPRRRRRKASSDNVVPLLPIRGKGV